MPLSGRLSLGKRWQVEPLHLFFHGNACSPMCSWKLLNSSVFFPTDVQKSRLRAAPWYLQGSGLRPSCETSLLSGAYGVQVPMEGWLEPRCLMLAEVSPDRWEGKCWAADGPNRPVPAYPPGLRLPAAEPPAVSGAEGAMAPPGPPPCVGGECLVSTSIHPACLCMLVGCRTPPSEALPASGCLHLVSASGFGLYLFAFVVSL